MSVNYHNRKFRPVSVEENSQTSASTVFHYYQQGDILYGDYQGGQIRRGYILGRVAPDGSIDMRYQHITDQGALMTGTCRSSPEIMSNGKIRLKESWQWTCGDHSKGTSVIEEV